MSSSKICVSEFQGLRLQESTAESGRKRLRPNNSVNGGGQTCTKANDARPKCNPAPLKKAKESGQVINSTFKYKLKTLGGVEKPLKQM